MSANIGNAENGFGTAEPSPGGSPFSGMSPSSGGGSSAITRDATRPSGCGHFDHAHPGNVAHVAVVPHSSGSRRRVYVRGARGGLGWCVAERLRRLDSVDVVVASGDAPAEPASGRCDTVVDV